MFGGQDAYRQTARLIAIKHFSLTLVKGNKRRNNTLAIRNRGYTNEVRLRGLALSLCGQALFV